MPFNSEFGQILSGLGVKPEDLPSRESMPAGRPCAAIRIFPEDRRSLSIQAQKAIPEKSEKATIRSEAWEIHRDSQGNLVRISSSGSEKSQPQNIAWETRLR